MKQYKVTFGLKVDADNPTDAENMAIEKLAHGYKQDVGVSEIVPYRTKAKPWHSSTKKGRK